MVSTRIPVRPERCQDELSAWPHAFNTLHIDIGTGDGTFALRMGREHPEMAVIGIDTCLDNLTKPAKGIGEPALRHMRRNECAGLTGRKGDGHQTKETE